MSVGFRSLAGFPLGAGTLLNPPPTAGFRGLMALWIGGGGQPGGSSTILAFSGISRAGDVTVHKGISKPNIIVNGSSATITHQTHNEAPGQISDTTYLIDGELP